MLGVCKVVLSKGCFCLLGGWSHLSELSVAKEVRLGAVSAWDERGNENRGQPGVDYM